MSARPLPRTYWSKIDRSAIDTSQCWPWTGARSGGRYGHFMIDGKFKYAHRLMYENIYGPIPDGMLVMHTCDNPQCVRPGHLKLGTNADNTADSLAKGRHKGYRGGLDEFDVLSIRERRLAGERVKDIAKDYAHLVSACAIHSVVSGKTWTHVR